MKKTNNKHSILIQRLIVLFIILCGAGYYYFHFIVNANLRAVIPGKIYRSAQPSETQLRKWVKKYGIKTVINLRAKKQKDIEKEKKTSDQLGIKLMCIDLSAKRLITCPELLELVEALETAQTPVLLHCKSGIDRAGFASALAALAIGHVDFDIAKWQAYVPPGPWKRRDFSNTRGDYINDYAHISDALKLYEDYCRRGSPDRNDWQHFIKWAVELPPVEEANIEYKPVYSYFPFMGNDKQFFPIYTLLKDAYVQFSAEIVIIVLLIYYTRFCLKAAGK